MKTGILTVHLWKAQGVKAEDILLGRKDVYAKMWLSDSSGQDTSSVKSGVKKEGGKNPKWNEHLKLNVDYDDRSLLNIALKEKNIILGGEDVGGLRIQLDSLFERNPCEVPANWYPVFYESQWSGKKRQEGKLQLSFSFEEAQGQGASEPIGTSQSDAAANSVVGAVLGSVFGAA